MPSPAKNTTVNPLEMTVAEVGEVVKRHRVGKTAVIIFGKILCGETYRATWEVERGWSVGARNWSAAYTLVASGLATLVSEATRRHSDYSGRHRTTREVSIALNPRIPTSRPSAQARLKNLRDAVNALATVH